LAVVVVQLITQTLEEAAVQAVVAVAQTVELEQDQVAPQHKHQTMVELVTVIMVEQVEELQENLAEAAVAQVKLAKMQRQIELVLEETV
jgi:predicted S18 family serine protease